MSDSITMQAERQADNYLTHSAGLKSWLFTLDHKRIGIMYLVTILVGFLLGGVFALLLRTELIAPGATITTADQYNRWFTMHGAIMVFIVIIPGIPAALGNFVLPLMLGAKDVAFPRLNLASYWIFVAGVVLALVSLVLGGVDTGWTFYTPYSSSSLHSNTPVIPIVAGAFLMGFSSIFTGMNFVVTVHKMRPPGMTWFKLPLFIWSLYATGLVQVIATPVLGITLLLLIIERTMKVGIFDSALGGDPVLFQHFFWFYSHPAVYIMILPAMGIISELFSTFSHKHIFGYRFIAYSSIAIAMFGIIVWGHHMFTSGQSPLVNMIFSALTFSVSIPSAIKVFNWLATMYKGSIDLKTPMVYALSFMFLFGIGGLTGLFLATLATDIHLHDTYFVVAHFHYVMMGSALIGFFAGVHYWWPKMTGKMYDDRLGIAGCLITFVGFNVTFFPQFIMGSNGMPRRYYDYLDQFHSMHFISTLGSYMLAVGFVITAVCLLQSLFKGKPAPANPWGAGTMDWQCASPPPHHNFDEPPEARDPYDLRHLKYDPKIDGYVAEPAGAGEGG